MSDDLQALVAEAVSLGGGHHDCLVLGHAWVFKGGCNCGCELPDGDGCCSVPVYRCSSCGDYDYGDNEEADEIKRRCKEAHHE